MFEAWNPDLEVSKRLDVIVAEFCEYKKDDGRFDGCTSALHPKLGYTLPFITATAILSFLCNISPIGDPVPASNSLYPVRLLSDLHNPSMSL